MGAGGSQQTTQTQTLPPEVSYWSNKYLNALGNLIMNPKTGQLNPSPLPYQEVAPMTPQQLQASALTSAETYGPNPQGQLGQISQMGSMPNQQSLINGMMGTPYWQQQLQTNPMTGNALSLPALSQLAQLYMTGG